MILEPRLRLGLRRINRHLPEGAVEQAVRIVVRPTESTLFTNNRWLHRLLTNGIDAQYRTPDGETCGDNAWLADFSSPGANDLVVVHQFTVKAGSSTLRADLVVFRNGLPIVIIEVNDPTDHRRIYGWPTASFRTTKEHVPALFHYNQLMVISDGDAGRVGSLTSGGGRVCTVALDRGRGPPGEVDIGSVGNEPFGPQ